MYIERIVMRKFVFITAALAILASAPGCSMFHKNMNHGKRNGTYNPPSKYHPFPVDRHNKNTQNNKWY